LNCIDRSKFNIAIAKTTGPTFYLDTLYMKQKQEGPPNDEIAWHVIHCRKLP